MIIFERPNQKELKFSSDIQMNDILRRKSDNCYYEVQSIHKSKSEIVYYNFFGFSIKDTKNLNKYFHNEYSKIEVYKNE